MNAAEKALLSEIRSRDQTVLSGPMPKGRKYVRFLLQQLDERDHTIDDVIDHLEEGYTEMALAILKTLRGDADSEPDQTV